MPTNTVTPKEQETVPTTDKPVERSFTDPDAIKARFVEKFGADAAQLGEMVSQAVDKGIKAQGLDRIDRKFLAVPESTAKAEKEKELKELEAEVRSAWQAPDDRSPLKRGMDRFFRAVMFGSAECMNDEIVKMSRVMTIGTDADGGYIVPPGYVAELVKDAAQISQVFQHVRRIPVGTSAGTIPKASTNATVNWANMEGAITVVDPKVDETTWTIRRMSSAVKMSRELVNDSNPDVIGVVTEMFRDAIIRERDRVIVAGSAASKEPVGIYTATGMATTITGVTLNYDLLVDLHEGIDQRYFASPRCRWVMNQTNKARVMKLKDSQNRPLWEPASPANSWVANIFGHPVSVIASSTDMPDNHIIFGDFNYYYWFDRQAVTMERTIEGGDAFLNHEVWIKLVERVDGQLVMSPTAAMIDDRVIEG